MRPVGGVVVGIADPRWVYGICGVLCLLVTAGYTAPLLRVARATGGGPVPPCAEPTARSQEVERTLGA